jgi:hypothetical protein
VKQNKIFWFVELSVHWWPVVRKESLSFLSRQQSRFLISFPFLSPEFHGEHGVSRVNKKKLLLLLPLKKKEEEKNRVMMMMMEEKGSLFIFHIVLSGMDFIYGRLVRRLDILWACLASHLFI